MIHPRQTRYEWAAKSIHAKGERVTIKAIQAWLLAHERVGCSVRDAHKASAPYWPAAIEEMHTLADEISQQMADSVRAHPQWKRAHILARIRVNLKGLKL